jgi:sulfatase maturation enzyme AslB (radical SAM superfamily)
MIRSNFVGVMGLVQHNPQLLSLATSNLKGRLSQQLSRNRRMGQSAPPEQVTVIVTDLCNLRCKMCHFAHNANESYRLNRNGRMEPGLFYKLIDETPGTPLVSLTGGEPLLHPKLPDLIAYAKNKGRIVSLTTNGWHLASRAEEICAAGLDILAVSVDGPPTVHDHIRGRGSFQRLEKGLEAILRISPRPAVFTTLAISDLNFTHLVPAYHQSLQWGIDGTNFNHLWILSAEMEARFQAQEPSFQVDQVRWTIDPGRVDGEILADQLKTIQRMNWGRKFSVAETPFLNRQQIIDWYQKPEQFVKWTTTRCAWIRMKVWPDGSFKPCRGWIAGNIAQGHAMQLWNAQPMRDFRSQLAAHGTFPICARCCYLAHR